MRRILVGTACLLLAGGLQTGSAFGVVTVTCEASSTTPTGREVILLDCFLQTDTAFTLNSYKVSYRCSATLGGGATGSVDHLTIPATSCTFLGEDPACIIDGFQAICGSPTVCFSPAQCDGAACLEDPDNPGVRYCEDSGTCSDPSPYVDTNRLDYIFRGVAGFTATWSLGNCPSIHPFVSGNAPAGTGRALTPGPGLYIGSFYYRASDCSGGNFTLNVIGNNNPPGAGDATRAISTGGVSQLVVGSAVNVNVDTGLCCTDGITCVGNFNPYCCVHVQGGILSNPAASCPGTCLCADDSHCDDGNACTNDVCAPGNPASDEVGCIHPSNVPPGYCCDPEGIGPLDPLDDDNPCTVDYCQGGQYPAVHDGPAADGNPCPNDGVDCTDDVCESGFCTHPTSANGTPCTSDGNPCTMDVCSNGSCIHTGTGANGLPCPGDGIYCTVDVCSNGVCVHPNVSTYPCETVGDCPSIATGCTGSPGNPGNCTCTPPGGPCYGDIEPLPNGDGDCDVDDILCMVTGYALFQSCPTGDIEPCGGDGDIDVDDLLGIVAAFSGIAYCLHPCG